MAERKPSRTRVQSPRPAPSRDKSPKRNKKGERDPTSARVRDRSPEPVKRKERVDTPVRRRSKSPKPAHAREEKRHADSSGATKHRENKGKDQQQKLESSLPAEVQQKKGEAKQEKRESSVVAKDRQKKGDGGRKRRASSVPTGDRREKEAVRDEKRPELSAGGRRDRQSGAGKRPETPVVPSQPLVLRVREPGGQEGGSEKKEACPLRRSSRGPKPKPQASKTTAKQDDSRPTALKNDKRRPHSRGRSDRRDSSQTRPASAPVGHEGSRRRQGRTSSARQDTNRSTSRTRQFLSKIGQAITRRPAQPRQLSPLGTRVSLSSNGNNSIALLEYKKRAECQMIADRIQQGKWGKLDVLYLRIAVTMSRMTDNDEAYFKIWFQTCQSGSSPGQGLDILKRSPEKLMGISQDVEEERGSNYGVEGRVGVDQAGINAHGDQTRNSKATKPHQPKLDVLEINRGLRANLTKTGKQCAFESYFTIQVVLKYDAKIGVDIAGDIEAEPFGQFEGHWRKIEVQRKHKDKTDYKLWTASDWQRESNCEGFVSR